jgi:hypothetical protein
MKRPKITMYCTCGGKIELTFLKGTPASKQQSVAGRVFRSAHSGEGHALCDRMAAIKPKIRDNTAKGVYVFGDDPWI